MRYAILSDIHANLEALEAVLAKVDEIAKDDAIDQIWFLGDLVGYGPDPNECICVLRERTDVIIAGNHDWAAVGKIDLEDFSAAARVSAEWTAEQLTPEYRDFLANLPERLEIGDCTLVHGSPFGPLWEYLTSETLAERSFLYFDTRYCLVGHTHVPAIFIQPDTANVPTIPLADDESASSQHTNGAGNHRESASEGSQPGEAGQAGHAGQVDGADAVNAQDEQDEDETVELAMIMPQQSTLSAATHVEETARVHQETPGGDVPAHSEATSSAQEQGLAGNAGTEPTSLVIDAGDAHGTGSEAEENNGTDDDETVTALPPAPHTAQESQESAVSDNDNDNDDDDDDETVIAIAGEQAPGNEEAQGAGSPGNEETGGTPPVAHDDNPEEEDDPGASRPATAGTPQSEIESAEAHLTSEIQELLNLLGLSQNMVQVTNKMLTPPEGHWEAPPDHRAIINPGGVGQPRDGDPRAAFMIYDTERGFEFYRVPYNLEKTQEKIINAGLPQFLAVRLAYGR